MVCFLVLILLNAGVAAYKRINAQVCQLRLKSRRINIYFEHGLNHA